MNSKLLSILNSYKRVLIIGTYPPPLGGVSVHIYRLNYILKNSQVFDLSQAQKFKGHRYLKLLNLIINKKFDAVHIHTYDIKIIVIMLIFKAINKFDLIATSHNPRLFNENSKTKNFIYKILLKNLDILVVVGKHIVEDYQNRGIELPKKIIIEPAFLPPPEDDEEKILNTYPLELFEFIKKSSHIILANASQITFHNGIDLYGLDMCIELTAKLKKDYPNIGFIFALANENVNKEYLAKMKQIIKELDIEDNFYFLTGQKELWPLFKKADLMIRPTNTDGDALSIREALYFDCPAIASDVCDRPEGTIIFQNRDLKDLYIKTLGVLNEK